MKIAVVRSRFNEAVTGNMLTGCLSALREGGVSDEDIKVVEVPGTFEIPLAVQMVLNAGGYDAVITLGCVLRGETPHDVYICDAVIPKLQQLCLDYSVPVILGIITPITPEQAEARSTGEGNKGVEAARAALEMFNMKKNSSL